MGHSEHDPLVLISKPHNKDVHHQSPTVPLTYAVGGPDVPVVIAQHGLEHGQSSVLMSPLLGHTMDGEMMTMVGQTKTNGQSNKQLACQTKNRQSNTEQSKG